MCYPPPPPPPPPPADSSLAGFWLSFGALLESHRWISDHILRVKMAAATAAAATRNPPLPLGYDEDFVNAVLVEDDFECLICHLSLKEPVQTRCGHRFCKECLEQHFRRCGLKMKLSFLFWQRGALVSWSVLFSKELYACKLNEVWSYTEILLVSAYRVGGPKHWGGTWRTWVCFGYMPPSQVSKFGPRLSRQNLHSKWYPVLEMGQFLIPPVYTPF